MIGKRKNGHFNSYLIHYVGFAHHWDEWIDAGSQRFSSVQTFISRRQKSGIVTFQTETSPFNIGKDVWIMSKRTKKWRQSKIIDTKRDSKGNYKIKTHYKSPDSTAFDEIEFISTTSRRLSSK